MKKIWSFLKNFSDWMSLHLKAFDLLTIFFFRNFIHLGRVASTSPSSRPGVSTSSSSRLDAATGPSLIPDVATTSFPSAAVNDAFLSGPDASTHGHSAAASTLSHAGSDTVTPRAKSSSSFQRPPAPKGFWSDGEWFPSIRAWQKKNGRKRPRGGSPSKQSKYKRW